MVVLGACRFSEHTSRALQRRGREVPHFLVSSPTLLHLKVTQISNIGIWSCFAFLSKDSREREDEFLEATSGSRRIRG